MKDRRPSPNPIGGAQCVDWLARHLDEPTQESVRAVPGMGDTLVAMHAEGARAWPTVPLSLEEFLPFIAERLRGEGDPALIVQQLRPADLYLACACSRGVPEAAEAFREHLFPEIAASVRRLDRVGRWSTMCSRLSTRRPLWRPTGARPR